MTAAAKPTVAPLKPMSRQAIRRVLEQAREDVTQALTRHYQTQAELHRVLGITDELWAATQPDAAPEFETRVVKTG